MYAAQMRAFSVHRISGAFALAFSFLALLMVGIGYLQPPRPYPTDEGALARIFQLSVAAFVPAMLVFVSTADRRHPRGSAALVIVCLVALSASVVGLYMGENGYWYPLSR